MKKETVGQMSLDLMAKEETPKSPIELERAMQEEYLKELESVVEHHQRIYDGDFYVVVITKNEKLMPNVFRNYFTARLTCPTPDYDQTVFFHNKALSRIEYIWTIPSRDCCHHLKDNAVQVASEERQLLKFVLDFADGTLYKLCRKLNGEDVLPFTPEK